MHIGLDAVRGLPGSRDGRDGRDQGPPRSSLCRAHAPSVARARCPDGRDCCPPRDSYFFFISISSLLTSRRVFSPLTVIRGLSFSKVLRPMPLMRTTCIGSANGLAVR